MRASTITWEELSVPPTRQRSKDPPPNDLTDWRWACHFCLERSRSLTSWELDFVATVVTSTGAFLGLTPKRYQSGETDWDGRISKRDDALVRAYLYEAANALLTNCKKWSALKAWGMQLAKRRGLAKAKVAVARKLAVIMHQMWTTGEAFRWSSEAATGKPTAA